MKFIEYLRLLQHSIDCIEPEISLHIILGNESCDLDSMVSSLTLAYHYSTLDTYQNTIVIPVMNKPKHLFPIRVENLYILNKYNISKDWLVFRDSIPLESLANKYNLAVTLVDHHVLQQADKFLKPKVTKVIDHRPIDPTEDWGIDVEKDIQLVGSCCTIISTYLNISKETPFNISGMLYDVITYDTIGYQESAGKVKHLDLEAAESLEIALSRPVNNPEQRLKLFSEIFQAHKNISHLSSEQLLYKDLKTVEFVYISGLPMLVEEYFGRFDVQEAIEVFCATNKARVVLLMGLNVDNRVVKRDIALYTNEADILKILNDMLVSKFEAIKEFCELDNMYYYKQKNPKLSRKQLIPLIQSCLLDYQ